MPRLYEYTSHRPQFPTRRIRHCTDVACRVSTNILHATFRLVQTWHAASLRIHRIPRPNSILNPQTKIKNPHKKKEYTFHQKRIFLFIQTYKPFNQKEPSYLHDEYLPKFDDSTACLFMISCF